MTYRRLIHDIFPLAKQLLNLALTSLWIVCNPGGCNAHLKLSSNHWHYIIQQDCFLSIHQHWYVDLYIESVVFLSLSCGPEISFVIHISFVVFICLFHSSCNSPLLLTILQRHLKIYLFNFYISKHNAKFLCLLLSTMG